MMEKVEFAAIVVVEIEPPDGEYGPNSPNSLWYAGSRMVRGLSVFGRSREEVLEKIPCVLAGFTSICRADDETRP